MSVLGLDVDLPHPEPLRRLHREGAVARGPPGRLDQGLVTGRVVAAQIDLVRQRVVVRVTDVGTHGELLAGRGAVGVLHGHVADDRRGVVPGRGARVRLLQGVVREPLLAVRHHVEPHAAEVVLRAVVEERGTQRDALVGGDAVPGLGVALGLLDVGGLVRDAVGVVGHLPLTGRAALGDDVGLGVAAGIPGAADPADVAVGVDRVQVEVGGVALVVGPGARPGVGRGHRVVRVDGVDLLRHVVDEGGVGVALLLQFVTAVAVLEAEDRLVADVPHEDAGVVLVGVDPLGELGERRRLVGVVGEVVDAPSAARTAARLEPETADDPDAVGRGLVQQRLRGTVGTPGTDRVDAHRLQVRQIARRIGDGRAPGQALDLVGLGVDGQLPVALRSGDADGAARAGRRAGGAAVHLELPQGVAVAAGAGGAVHADVPARPGDGEVVRAAVAVGHGLQGAPVRSVVGRLDLVGLAVGGLPGQYDPAEVGGGAQVHLDPLRVAPFTGPAGAAQISVHGGGGRVAVPLLG